MPFVEINVKNEIQKQKQNDPEFRKAWDDSRAEYRLIGEMISLRKQENITQKKLASLTGNKQQVISRIERKESIPTIRAFSHILDALGYELQIVKKKQVQFNKSVVFYIASNRNCQVLFLQSKIKRR